MTEAIRPPGRASQVPDLAPLVRRVIAGRVADPTMAEDLCQETLERLVGAEHRLEPTALAPYAVVTARNVVRGAARTQEREARHRPRMLDLRQPEDPEEQTLREEERRAIVAALDRLPPTERESLLAHDSEGVETRALAESLGTTPRALSARLSRARARLRVEYVLALRRVELPTSACKRVLLALSAADKRQQRASGAGEHLLVCPPCAELSDALVRRRRPVAVLWPFLGLDHLLRWVRRSARTNPASTAVGTAAVAVVAAWAAVALVGGDPPAPRLFVQGNPPIPLSGDRPMDSYAERTVEARGVPVESVVDATGFWVGDSHESRVWVDVHDDTGSLPQIARGRRISFQGTLTPNTPSTLERAGRGGPADLAQLERQGYHIDVSSGTIRSA